MEFIQIRIYYCEPIMFGSKDSLNTHSTKKIPPNSTLDNGGEVISGAD